LITEVLPTLWSPTRINLYLKGESVMVHQTKGQIFFNW